MSWQGMEDTPNESYPSFWLALTRLQLMLTPGMFLPAQKYKENGGKGSWMKKGMAEMAEDNRGLMGE